MDNLQSIASRLCCMDGVCGYEDAVRDEIKHLVSPRAESMTEDAMGNLLVFVKGKARRLKPVLLCAHMDEIGAIVFRISNEGLLYIRPVGYVDLRVFLGKQVRVGGNNGIIGVVGTKSMQLMSEEEKKVAPEANDIYVDIGAQNREDAVRYVKIGDQITFLGEALCFGDRHFMAKAIDDRLLCAVLLEVLKKEIPYDTWFVFTTSEEDGLRGASVISEQIRPQCAMILEGTTAGDFPGVKPHLASTVQGCGAAVSLVDRGTFYHEGLMHHILSIADQRGIQWQYRTTMSGRTDSGALSIRSGGVKTFGVSIPTRYGHSQVSHVFWPDVEQVVAMAELFVEVTGEMNI